MKRSIRSFLFLQIFCEWCKALDFHSFWKIDIWNQRRMHLYSLIKLDLSDLVCSVMSLFVFFGFSIIVWMTRRWRFCDIFLSEWVVLWINLSNAPVIHQMEWTAWLLDTSKILSELSEVALLLLHRCSKFHFYKFENINCCLHLETNLN